MDGPVRKTKTTTKILEALMKDPTQEIHGFDLVKATGLRSGSVYPVLRRFEGYGWLTSWWEESADSGPRKRFYRLTAEGQLAAREYLQPAEKPARGTLRGVPPHGGEALA